MKFLVITQTILSVYDFGLAEADNADNLMDTSVQENTLKALYDKKQEILAELKGYENNIKQAKAGTTPSPGSIPAGNYMSNNYVPYIYYGIYS
jgi:tRNA A-37 threonylcarbamoyl transferase component Bud32